MLSEARVKEAESNVRRYIDDGLLRKVTKPDFNVKNIMVRNCEESLKVAEIVFNNGHSYLWTVVCSYYSMFYIANAVLYGLSLKVGDKIVHKVTADALIVHIRNKLTKKLLEDYEKSKEEALQVAKLESEELLRSFDSEQVKRSTFQYGMTEQVIKGKAQTSLGRAKKFVFELSKLIRQK